MNGSAIEVLDRSQCVDLLSDAVIGRVSVSIGALPVILPINYLSLGDSIVFRASRDSDLYRASINSVAAFETDQFDTEGTTGWSVMVCGIAAEITDLAELGHVQRAWQRRWPDASERVGFVAVPCTVITGHRIAKFV